MCGAEALGAGPRRGLWAQRRVLWIGFARRRGSVSGPAGGRRGPSPPATHEFRMVNALSNRTGGLIFLFYFWSVA